MFFGLVRNQFAIRYNLYCTELETKTDLFDDDLISIKNLVISRPSETSLGVLGSPLTTWKCPHNFHCLLLPWDTFDVICRCLNYDIDFLSKKYYHVRTFCTLYIQVRCLLNHETVFQRRTSSPEPTDLVLKQSINCRDPIV